MCANLSVLRSDTRIALLVLALSGLFACTARADVRELVNEGKVSWSGNPAVIYLLKGNVSTDVEYDELILKFTDTTTPGTFTVGADTKISVRSLVVGGGGAGGTSTNVTAGAGGGGGAGGFIDQMQTIEAGTYIITVGAGGSAATTLDTAQGADGNDSSFVGEAVSLVAKGGGGGGAQSVGRSGGSGGGGSYALATCNGGSGTTDQGKAGGSGSSKKYGAGGGGAGSDGTKAGSLAKGGVGLASDIVLDENGDPIYYAGGGGGGRTTLTTRIAGGAGGGGAGGSTTVDAGAGHDGFGGGGGGGGSVSPGGAGGDGVVILRIRDVLIMPPGDVELEWDGENQVGYEPKNYYEIVDVAGDATNATVAGSYRYHVKPSEGFEWADGSWETSSTETKTIEWKIVPMQVDVPTSVLIVYDGDSHEMASSDEIYEIVDGTAVATNAGEYSFTMHLRDAANTIWSDGTTTDKAINWAIVAKPVEKPAPIEGFVYSGTNSIAFTEYEGVVFKDGVTNSVNAGNFHYTVALDNPVGYTNYVWVGASGDACVANVCVDWMIAPQLVDIPVPRTGLVYNELPQDAFENLDWSRYSLAEGTTNETSGGSYEAVFHLSGNDEAENFVWNVVPETAADYTVSWSIGADINEITELKLDGWRIGATPNTPMICAKWGSDTVEYSYGFGDDAESVTSWTTDADDITTAGVWVLRAVIPETSSWTATTNYTMFIIWDDPSVLFRNRVDIFVKGTTNELFNFVVPIRISEDSMQGFYYTDANPTNLVFVDDIGRLLSYDVDTWDTSGESVIWVKLVTLPTDGMTVTMYWNLREGQIAPENIPTDVWSDYVGVWHMTGASDSAAGASTGRLGNKTTAVDGIFGGALSASIQGEPLILAAASEAVNSVTSGAFTVSFYTKYNATTHGSAAQYLFSRRRVLGDAGYALLIVGGLTSTATQFIECFGNTAYHRYSITDATPMTRLGSDRWVRNDIIYTSNGFYWYINGEELYWLRDMSAGFSNGTTGLLGIGGLAAANSDSNINGAMDEFRIYPGRLEADRVAAEYTYHTDPTMVTNGVVYKDGLRVDYWVVEPEMDKTQWDVNDAEKGQITNFGQLRYGEMTNYIYSVYDESEVYSAISEITHGGTYRAVFARVPTEDFQPLEHVIEFRITQSKPYTKIGGTNGNSGRVLLMNRDTNTGAPTYYRCPIDRQGYSDTSPTQSTFWQVFGTDEDGLPFNLRPGPNSILWTRNYGEKLWHLENCRHGNTNPQGANGVEDINGNVIPATYTYTPIHLNDRQNYLPYSSTSYSINNRVARANPGTAGQVVMRNMVGATVYSPCYTNGIGTIYFDAVNGSCRYSEDYENYKLVVEIATNTVECLEPTDINCLTVSYETNVVDDVEVETITTNWYGKLENCWHAVPVIPYKRDALYGMGTFDRLDETNELALAVTCGGTMGNFYRVVVPLDIAGSVRFRIRRTTYVPDYIVDGYGFILLDNIIASIPAMGAELVSPGRYDTEKTGLQALGWELATSVPYPSVNDTANLVARAKPVFALNAGDGSTPDTNNFFSSAMMHYRWRYLNQQASDWKEIALDPGDNFKAIGPLDLPNRPGDVEYWFEYQLQAPYYEYVDYSGIGKQIDYTEERGVQTNRLNGTMLASSGTDWFFRVREGKSDYAGFDIVYRRGESAALERVHMALVEDHVWRGFVQTRADQVGEIKFHIEALDHQTAEFAEYAATTNYFCGRTNYPTIPFGDSLVEVAEGVWSTLTLDATTGYVMFQIDDSSKTMTVAHADYQDVNSWSDALGRTDMLGRGPIFVDTSSVSPTKQTFAEDFSDWQTMSATNNLWGPMPTFADIQPSHLYGRMAYKPFSFDTDGPWSVGKGMWVAKKYADQRNNMGVALQMEGNGNGYLQFTDRDLAPRGIESISFNARIGQAVQFDDFAYYYGGLLGLSNYTFMARTAFDLNKNKGFTGNASLSVVANYLPSKGCYEARWEWLGNNNTAQRGQRLCLYRWNVTPSGTKSAELIVARTNTTFHVEEVTSLANSTSQRFTPMFISVSNDVPNGCTYVVAGIRRCGVALGTNPIGTSALNTQNGRNANWFGVCFRDTTTKRLTKGTYGVLSANCDGVFARPEFSHTTQTTVGSFPAYGRMTDSFDNMVLSQISNLQDIKNCATDDLQDSEYPGWNIVPGRMTSTYTSTAINAVMSAPLAQDLQIFLGTAGRADWSSTPYTNIVLKSFGGSEFNLPFYTTRDCSVKFAVAGTIEDVRTDVVIDTVVLRQWCGGDWNDDNPVNGVTQFLPAWADASHRNDFNAFSNFVFTSCWVTNHAVLMSAKRSNLDTPCAIRSPLMDGFQRSDGTSRGKGLGMVAIEYANAQENVVLELQIATNNVSAFTIDAYDRSFDPAIWTTVADFDFSAMTAFQRKSGILNCYVGLHDVTGAMRILMSKNVVQSVANETNPERFGDVTITRIVCRDEPPIDVHSWWGFNMRTVGGDNDSEKKMLLSDFGTWAGAAGLSLALNNSVDANYDISEIDVSGRESYIQHKPFVQTPTFTSNVVGEVSFKARKYAAGDAPSTVVLFGSNDVSETDDGTWHRIDGAVFSVTNDWYETHSYKTDPSRPYKAFRLAVAGVEGVVEGASGGGNGLPPGVSSAERVLLDEMFVREAIRARMGFRSVGCFKSDIAGTEEVPNVPSALEQPHCNEVWGVQCEVYGAQMVDDIDFSITPQVRLRWFNGTSPWGYENWKDLEGCHSAWLSLASDVEDGRYIYRTSQSASPESVVPMSTSSPSCVQYMLEVVYYPKGSTAPTTNILSSADWMVPEWYGALEPDVQQGISSGAFAAFNVIDDDAPPSATATQTTPVPVPYAELESRFASYLSRANGDYEAAANLNGLNGCTIWQSYLAGLVPDDEESRFFAKIVIVDGKPVVTWEPDTPELRTTRVYKKFGKKHIGDPNEQWSLVEDGNEGEYRFFKVSVEMP